MSVTGAKLAGAEELYFYQGILEEPSMNYSLLGVTLVCYIIVSLLYFQYNKKFKLIKNKIFESFLINVKKYKIYFIFFFIINMIARIYLYGFIQNVIFIIILLVLLIFYKVIVFLFPRYVEELKEDQITLQKHLEDFPMLNSLFNTSFFLLVFLIICLIFGLVNITDKYILVILSIYLALMFIKSGVSIYCILYKNTKTWQVFSQVCITCAKPIIATGVMTHAIAYVPIPNPMSDLIHIWSPFGKGYATRTLSDYILVDTLKSGLGDNFNYHRIVDKDHFVNGALIQEYALENKTVLQKNLTPTQQILLNISSNYLFKP